MVGECERCDGCAVLDKRQYLKVKRIAKKLAPRILAIASPVWTSVTKASSPIVVIIHWPSLVRRTGPPV